MPQQAVLAVDIGGTKFAAAIIDTDGRLRASDRAATPRVQAGVAAGPEDLFAALYALCERVMRQADEVEVLAIGVGSGGPMLYPSGRISPLNIPGWRDFPLRDRLAEAFDLRCIVDNDAKAMALGEQWRGAGQGSRNMLGMVISTGVGGGIILDGRLLHGHQGNGGHIGHVIVWPGGPPCGCGAHGCLEGVASGTGLTRRLGLALDNGATTVLARGASAAEITAAARTGDALSIELMRTAGEGVGRGIACAAALLDLELVAIGGSIALKAWDLIGPPLLDELARTARLDFTREVRVVQAGLGDQAGLYGAAALAYQHFPDVVRAEILPA